MTTIFEHIVSRRLSHQYEDVATEALAFILDRDQAARDALIDLLRSAQPALSPTLVFSAQDAHAGSRPDLAGRGPDGAREVFIENKFWAGLTEGQPVAYLNLLAARGAPTLLVFVVPDARAETLWAELMRRARAASPVQDLPAPSGFVRLAHTGLGPHLGLTTWKKLLTSIALATAGDPALQSDLAQLRGLCDRADAEAFVPLASTELTDQRVPTRILQFTDIAEKAVGVAIERGKLSTEGLRATHFWDGMGRYIRFGNRHGVGAWFGVDLSSWRTHGRTPLWARFGPGGFGRGTVVGPMLRQWSVESGRAVFVTADAHVFVGLDLEAGVEQDQVIDGVADQLVALHSALANVPRTTEEAVPEDAKA